MRVLHTADWHLGSFRGPEENGVNLRSEDTIRCLEELVHVARQEKPEFVLVSGDIFHKAEVWQGRSHKEVLQARRVILNLAEVSQNVVVMRGTPNHDSAEAFEELQAHFEFVQNVHIVTMPQVISFEGVDIAVLPGFDRGVFRAKFPGLSKEEENEVFTKELSNIVLGLKAQCNPNKASILMSHYTVPGCNTESGQVMMLTQFEPVLPVECLIAADYDLVALGHIHRPQKIPNIKNCFYSGAVNAMNFNDEGQDRGFWVHESMPFDTWNWNSTFYKTPYREFITFHFTDTDITAINHGRIDEVAMNYWRWNGAVTEKIVRIHYSCSYENNKALNKALLERVLLDDGAFMVWEILPKKIGAVADRNDMSSTTDPEENLRRYLEEKHLYTEDKIQELILKARPIIAEAEAGISLSAATGTFEPVEISVRNYRNYAEETFNFEDISFCTINGQNGAGKSSLFMDAIIDCLYEEPREGELTGWIRNDEKARSGSIMFTFRIGEKTFRVTRTRARSGKGTLNLAELVDSEWVNRSKEKYKDTQTEIINILGMDSLTFKSCALIMQDQYGLFLQAPKEDRMVILGNLLGLGVYQAMEKIACDKAKMFGAKARELRHEIGIHDATIKSYKNPEMELDSKTTELKECEIKLQLKMEERDKNKLQLTHCQEAAERRDKLLASIKTLETKKATAEQNMSMQKAIYDGNSIILNSKAEIEGKVKEYEALLEKERILSNESALCAAKKTEAEEAREQERAETDSINNMNRELERENLELQLLQDTGRDAVIRENAAEYERYAGLLREMQESYVKYTEAITEKDRSAYAVDSKRAYINQEARRLNAKKADLQKRTELLENSGCPDIDHAECRFLSDALDAKKQLPVVESEIADFMSVQEQELKALEQDLAKAEQAVGQTGYDANLMEEYRRKLAELASAPAALKELEKRSGRIALIRAKLDNLQSNISETEKRLSAVKSKALAAEQERDTYAESFAEHERVKNALIALKPWLEREKQLPIAEERKTNAACRLLELSEEISAIDDDIKEKSMEADRESLASNDIERLTVLTNGLDIEVNAINETVKRIQMDIGALRQKMEEIGKLKKEIDALTEQAADAAKETADYDTLKIAFSQDGIPHQIIRSIIPQLTATANNILGQMTGGKMGIGFKTEKVMKSNSKKEVVTLDIFIEEYGKSALPYLSKSGGEKVKSSLSVILALAEIKSSSAGIQLGMLFIDEPPFLDGDGIQAYCDALETIQSRYANIKIMAITHDPTMKARFPQNLDVIKTDNGSKVIY